jgi:hypothetical protein
MASGDKSRRRLVGAAVGSIVDAGFDQPDVGVDGVERGAVHPENGFERRGRHRNEDPCRDLAGVLDRVRHAPVVVARVARVEHQHVFAAGQADAALEAEHDFLTVMVMTAVPGRHAGGQLGQDQLEVALRLGRQHLDQRGGPADLEPGPLGRPHDVRDLLLLDDEVGNRGLERAGEVLEGGKGRRGSAVLDLADETL